MTIQQLQYVVALDTHRHFVRAAESCFVAQPTLTLQVKKLEQEIGLQIFERVQPLRPTAMGQVFIGKARQILRDINQLKELVNHERDQMQGTYRLGIIPSLSPYLLPLFLHAFAQAYPETTLEVVEWQSQQIIDGLHQNTLDIGLLVTPLEEQGLREVPVFYEPFLVFAHQGHGILQKEHVQAAQLEEKGLWLLDHGHCFRNQILNICNLGSRLAAADNIMFQSGAIETVKRMVQTAYGYTLIPELAYDEAADKPFVRRFAEPEPVREVSLVVHNSFTKEKLLTEMRSTIQQHLPSHLKQNKRFVTVKWR